MIKSIIIFLGAVILAGAVRADDNLGPLDQIKFEGLKGSGFDFLKKGDIYHVSLDSQHVRFNSLSFYAIHGSRNLIPLTDSLSNISFVISSEVDGSSIESFIKNRLALFLVMIQARPGPEILYKNYMDEYRRSFGKVSDPDESKTPLGIMKVTGLQKFCSGVATNVEKDAWDIEFNVITGAGGVEQWRAAGNLTPRFVITEFATKTLAPQGAFQPIPTMGLIKAE
jgi:hypothetical protein